MMLFSISTVDVTGKRLPGVPGDERRATMPVLLLLSSSDVVGDGSSALVSDPEESTRVIAFAEVGGIAAAKKRRTNPHRTRMVWAAMASRI